MKQLWGTLIAAALVVGSVPAAALHPAPAQAVEAAEGVMRTGQPRTAGEVGDEDAKLPPLADIPDAPLLPGDDAPDGPGEPGEPAVPADPIEPAAPTEPGDPGDLGSPAAPGEGETPVQDPEPGEPGAPQPTEPSDPAGDPVPIAAPATPPSIGGSAVVGGTVRAHSGDWGAADLSLKIQWLRAGTAIPGATAAQYTLRAEDAGAKLTVRVTASRAGVADRSADSAALTVRAASFTAGTVTVSGTARVGHSVQAKIGTWKPAGAKFSYQWQRNGAAISGATGAHYTLTAKDHQQRISVRVTAKLPGYSALTAASKVTSPVAAGTLTPAAPKITGTTTVGKTLTARTAAWKPGKPKLTHQWKRNGTAIARATGSSYRLVSADAGKRITVTVTGKLAGYATASKTSAKTAAVVRPLAATPTPKISGTARVGTALTARPGTWKPGGVKLSYQWLRGGKAISGATKSQYTPGRADAGAKLSVRVTGKKSGYATAAKTSAAVGIPRVLRAATPKISGAALIGSRLTVQRGTWTAGTAYSTQWYRNGAAIPKATGVGYTLTPADRGSTITVSVRGTLRGYAAERRTSAKTAAVRYPSSTRPTSLWNCPAWAPIKGNASSGIYHRPGGAFYHRTMPEECFVSEAAAQRAGYRASKR